MNPDMEYDALKNFRKQIDNINDEIMILLKRRMQFSKKVIKYKIENNMEILNQQREDDILKGINKQAITMGLSEAFVRNLFQSIMDESKREQEKFLDKYNRKKELQK